MFKGALVLDRFLPKMSMLEDRFTVTDIIVSYSLNWAVGRTESFPSIDSYLKRLFSEKTVSCRNDLNSYIDFESIGKFTAGNFPFNVFYSDFPVSTVLNHQTNFG